MSLDIIRQNIVAAMEAAKVGTPGGTPVVEYDNRMLVNTQTQSTPFVICNIVYGMGEQADLNAKPIHRLYGQIHLIVATKEGGGSTDAAKMLGYLYPQLQGKVFGIVRTSFASPAPPKPHLGWVYTPILIPFWADITY